MSFEAIYVTGEFYRLFVWGTDASGTMQGAGGVGGLLWAMDDGQTHAAGYDANGNIIAWVNTADGTLSGIREYGAFGENIAATGVGVVDKMFGIPFGFSTKYQDRLTGHYYYGYRFYGTNTGRWLSNDPIEEQGGLNLYAFVGNNLVNWVDYLGLKICRTAIFVGHASLPDSDYKPSACDRSVLVTCMRKRLNEQYNQNTGGKGVPDHHKTRNDGYLFPNLGGDYESHPLYKKERGDITVQLGFERELMNAETEAKESQCKDIDKCCEKVEIRIYSLDADGRAWMQRGPNFYRDGDLVKTIYCGGL